jgi:hypothetical protein
MLCQVLGTLNARFEFGVAKRPSTAKASDALSSECLVKVYATMPIKAGGEILCTYGEDFWA